MAPQSRDAILHAFVFVDTTGYGLVHKTLIKGAQTETPLFRASMHKDCVICADQG